MLAVSGRLAELKMRHSVRAMTGQLQKIKKLAPDP